MPSTLALWRAIASDFNTMGPARPEDFRKLFVDRNEDDPTRSVVQRLKLAFQNSIAGPRPYKATVAGQVGSGKSTELMRLAEELAEDFFVVWFDAATVLSGEKSDPLDVLLGLGVSAHLAAQMTGLDPPDELAGKLVESFARFAQLHEDRKRFLLNMETLVSQTAPSVITGSESWTSTPALTEAKFSPLRFDLDLSDDSVEKSPPNPREVVKALNEIVDFAQWESKRPMLIITDGLDKVSAARAHQMFAESALLAEPACALIYATPIEFYYRLMAGQAGGFFDECMMLPNPPVHLRPCGKEREMNERGISVMRRIIARRLEAKGLSVDEVISSDALTLLARMSGGVMRELIRYFRDSITTAQLLGKSRIDEDVASEVIGNRRHEMIARLKASHRDAIRRILMNGYFSGGEAASIEDEILRNLYVLSYQDENGYWLDAHPIILPAL
jgi:hypothetical protein